MQLSSQFALELIFSCLSVRIVSEYNSDFSNTSNENSKGPYELATIKESSIQFDSFQCTPYFLRFSSYKNQCYANAIIQAFLYLGETFKMKV